MIGFLIRCAFWLSLVLLVIPIGTGDDENAASSVGPIQAFFAAREAVQDVAGICDRKPEVCTTGRAALHTIGTRAMESAQLASQMLDDDTAPRPAENIPADAEKTEAAFQAEPDRRITTGTIAIPTPRPSLH